MGWFKKLGFATMRFERATNPTVKFAQNVITDKVFKGDQLAAANMGHSVGVGVIDYFFPGVGSALNATSQYQDGDYKAGNRSLVSAGFQSWASGSWSNSSPTTTAPQGYTSSDLGSGITTTAQSEPGITGSINATRNFESYAQAGTVVDKTAASFDNAVVGFTSSDLGAGITATDAGEVGATNLTVRDIRQNTTYKAVAGSAVKLYDLVTRDGSVLATFGNRSANQVTNFNLQYAPPTNIGAIPSVAQADQSAQLAAQHLADLIKQKQMKTAIFLLIAGFIIFKGK